MSAITAMSAILVSSPRLRASVVGFAFRSGDVGDHGDVGDLAPSSPCSFVSFVVKGFAFPITRSPDSLP